MLELRKEHYLKKVKDDSTQNDFLNGWNNRVNKLDKILKESKKRN